MKNKNTSFFEFAKEEKLATIKMLDAVIFADSKVEKSEMAFLNDLMTRYNFDIFFIARAREVTKEKALMTLQNMSTDKKIILAELLDSAALSDGNMHPKEAILIKNTLGLNN